VYLKPKLEVNTMISMINLFSATLAPILAATIDFIMIGVIVTIKNKK
jgi:hypothetical protein